MNIDAYKLAVEEGFEWLTSKALTRWMLAFDGKSQLATWVTPDVAVLKTAHGGQPREYADLPWVGHGFLAIREAAIDRVRPILEDCGEFLPLSCDDGTTAHLFNSTATMEPDLDMSELVLSSNGRVMGIENHVFSTAFPDSLSAFKATGFPDGVLLFTEPAAAAITALGLRGVKLVRA